VSIVSVINVGVRKETAPFHIEGMLEVFYKIELYGIGERVTFKGRGNSPPIFFQIHPPCCGCY
jgi:hypothetical protein